MEIRALRDAAEAETYARMMSSTEPWITLRRDYQKSLEAVRNPDRECYVAVRSGQVLGFVIISMKGAFVGYLQSVCVAPDSQGRGIGQQLIRFAENRIWRDAPNVFICASSFNPRAKMLYERLGYQTVGELKDWIVAGHSEFLMRKTIAPLAGYAPAATSNSES